MSPWKERLPSTGPGSELDGARIDRFIVDAAAIIVDARNRNDLQLADSVLDAATLEASQRIDDAAARSAASGTVVAADRTVELAGVAVRPIGVRAAAGGGVVARAEVTHDGRLDDGSRFIWKEVWDITIPVTAPEQGAATARCVTCGAPRDSVRACTYCGTRTPHPALAEAEWRITRRAPL